MKAVSFFILSFLLVVAIMAPSVITLLDIDNKTEIVMDFSEEDNKKEEKKEAKEKKLFSRFELYLDSRIGDYNSKVTSSYIEKNYSHSASIFLPPPEYLS